MDHAATTHAQHAAHAGHGGQHAGHDHGAMIADFRRRFRVSLVLTVSVLALSRATYGTLVQNLARATGYNAFAIPLAAGVACSRGIVLGPAVGAALMSLSTSSWRSTPSCSSMRVASCRLRRRRYRLERHSA